MKMIKKEVNTAGRGLGRAMTMIVGAAVLSMIAGSAQAQSDNGGGGVSLTARDHGVSVSERSSRDGRSLSILIDGDQVELNTRSVALRSGGEGHIGNINPAGHSNSPVVVTFRGGRPISLHPIDIDIDIDIDRPLRPGPVAAVPEPGAALLFGAGIVLAGIRRR